MTNVTIFKDGNIRKIVAECHTDPIVCAGVSAICFSLSGWCINNREHLKHLKHIESDGFYECFAECDEISMAVFEMAEIGLYQIQLANPKHISITEE